MSEASLQTMHKLFGYTDEVIRTVIVPMAEYGQEPVISMGYDSPLAVLSQKNQSLFTYFKQQFAQVTNPPIDAIREKIVVGTEVYLGRDGDLRSDDAANCVKLKLDSSVLSTLDFEKIAFSQDKKHKSKLISTLYDVTKETQNRLENALVDMFKAVEVAVDNGASIIILSDRDQAEGRMPMPILLATSGLYNYMVEKGKGSQFSIVVDTAEVNEVHHFATIIGYGASAIHPYGAYQTLVDYHMADKVESFRHAAEKGIIKVMNRMGISTISGYKGAQLFEAVGLSSAVVDNYFRGTVTRIGGLSLDQIETEYLERYAFAYGPRSQETLPSGGSYQFKTDGEHHIFNPLTIYNFQKAVRQGDYALYKAYAEELQVEAVENIVTRFKVGAMSFGSLSKEAHETIAEAMNSIGAKSNSGEGGENRARYYKKADGTNLNSKIKQIASGRFGVNAEYVMSAEELQIKLAQGAKPGEGGQLPGGKAFPWVAEIRGSTPGVTLISPPPHHDIYSIEDLAQLIYDLKAVNPYAKINVKLVSSTGVGTIATGCVKAGADKVVIAGYDGGTGASPRNSARDAGLPWEMGLAEAHQTLTMNNL